MSFQRTSKFWLASATLLALAACGDNGADSSYAPEMEEAAMDYAMSPAPPPPMEARAMQKVAFDEDMVEEQAGGGGPGGEETPQPEAVARQIAYTYAYGFRVPSANLEGLMTAQKAACEKAGPAVCYVEYSNVNGLGQDYASGNMQLRASALWVEAFRNGLAESLKPFDAELDSTNQTAEDLTTRILDTTATLNSRKTLRERLQKLLAERPGKLSDLLEIERELARVQQEIDSTESILAAMKQRVSMSTLTLSYQAKYAATSESIWRPLGDAFEDFLGNVVESVAALVEFVSHVFIWLVVFGGVIWFLLSRWSKRRKAKAAPANPAAPAETA